MSPDPRLPLVADLEGPLITVHGPTGVGASALVRTAFPRHAVVDARHADADTLRATRGPVVWDDVDPAIAAEAWSAELGPVVVVGTGRTRRAEERAVRVDPLPDADLAPLLHVHGPDVPGLAAACFGLPDLVPRAHELHLLLGRVPTAADWLRLGPLPQQPAPREAVERQVARAPGAAPLLDALGAFGGPFTLHDLEGLVGTDPLQALGAAVDGTLVVPRDDGVFEVPPLLRAWLAERPGCLREAQLEALAAACPAVVERLERDGTTPTVAHRHADLLAAGAQRLPGWTAALWLATLQRPTEVPRTVLVAARADAPDDPWVARSFARHLRATGALAEAEALLADVDHPGARRELGALHHRARRLDAADALYRADPGLSRRSDALADANRAAIAHDRGDLDAAATGYARALRELSLAGDDRATGLVASNLGALQAEAGDVDAARASFGRAVRALEAAREPRLWSIAAGNLAWLDARTGAPDRALRLLDRALQDGAPDERTAATLWMRIGAVHASQGDADAAGDAFDTVDALLRGSEDTFALALAERFRAFQHLVEGRRLEALAALDAGETLLATSDDARTATAWIQALLRRRPGQSLVVAADGSSVRTPDGTPHTVANRAARLLLAGLAARWSPHGVGLGLDGLFALGWPGEKAVVAAQRNRVHVALSALRKAGLKPFIVRDEVGHLLDPAVPVLLSD